VKIGGDQVIEAMLKKYGIALDGDAPAFFEFLIKGQPPAGNNVVAVMQGGKPVWFEVGDPIAYRALKAIDRPIMSTRWSRCSDGRSASARPRITATPDFWVANMARDTLMGSVMSRALASCRSWTACKGMTSADDQRPDLSKTTWPTAAACPRSSSTSIISGASWRRYYRDQKIDYRTVLDAPDKLLTLRGDAWATRSRVSTRLGEYKRAIDCGENPRHAAYQGRDVSRRTSP
jgi:hypothetical protein